MKSTRDLSDRHEAHLAKVLHGRRTRGSGNQSRDQGDGKQDYAEAEWVFCWDGKSTRARSITVHRSDWEKITEQSHWALPLLPLRFYFNDRLTEWLDLVVCDLDTFSDLQQVANEVVPLRDEVARLTEDNQMLRHQLERT